MWARLYDHATFLPLLGKHIHTYLPTYIYIYIYIVYQPHFAFFSYTSSVPGSLNYIISLFIHFICHTIPILLLR